MTASLLVLSGVSGMLAPPAADAADRIVVYVRDDGFSQTDIKATKGDMLVFVMDSTATREHAIAWERGYLEHDFWREGNTKEYGPLNPTPAPINFYDSRQLQGRGPHPRGPFSGTLTVTETSSTSPSTPTTSTTATTAPPSTVTTAPTTTTSAPTAIKPQLVSDPPSTTTTTAAPTPPTTAKIASAPPPTPAPKKDNKDKDKAKSKPPSTETTATTAPAPPDTAWIDSLLGEAALTPSPAMPDQPAGDSEDEAAIDAAQAASLLDKPAPDDDNKLLLIALGAIAAVLLSGGFWAWFTRASRYDPA